MADQTHYDAIVIGSGQAGGPLSTALAGAGRKTALIEREHIGGTCINVGCTPTKTMIASGRIAHLARRAADYGVQTGPITVDQTVVRQRKRDIVESFRSGSERRITNAKGLDLIRGEATFTGPRAVHVERNDGAEQELTADLFFIDTGTRPATPKIAGIDTVPYLTSTTIMELDETPEHLIVLGGGYIGLEFAQLFRRLGSRVTIVQRGGSLLSREDNDIAEAMREILAEDGIEILLNASATEVRTGNGGVSVSVRSTDGEEWISGSHLLVATGRAPNSDGLNLDAAGVDVDDKGFIRVNNRLETNVEGIYALGDVKGGPQFTHISYDDFRIVRDNLLNGGNRTTADRPVPYVVFTDPELGRIGLTEREARKQGYRVKAVKMAMTRVARASEMDETRGVMKVVVDAQTDLILGGAILGVWGGEIMTQLQMAMMGGLTRKTLSDAVFAHPTLGESINNLLSALEG